MATTSRFEDCRTPARLGILHPMHELHCNRMKIDSIGRGRRALLARAWVPALLLGLSALAKPAPLAHGVIFFCPPREAAAIAELQKIQADGFNLIEFASWPWTLPNQAARWKQPPRQYSNGATRMRFGSFSCIISSSTGGTTPARIR